MERLKHAIEKVSAAQLKLNQLLKASENLEIGLAFTDKKKYRKTNPWFILVVVGVVIVPFVLLGLIMYY